jgi:hypothetical protein
MKNMIDRATIFARAEAHASLLESVAAMMELDGIGLDPGQGHVHHLRCMAGAIRAQAALGKLAQRYSGERYLPDPASSRVETNARKVVGTSDTVWH